MTVSAICRNITGFSRHRFNANNQVQSVTVGFPPQYDAAGNLKCENYNQSTQTCYGPNQYLYDAEGRICAVQSYLLDGAMTGYLYDAEGTRVAKGTLTQFTCDTNPSDGTYNGFTITTSYILGPGNEQLAELAWSGGVPQPAHTNVCAAGQLAATYSNSDPTDYPSGILYFHLTDWLGTRRVLTNADGSIAQSCDSLPYGDGESCPPSPTEHLFTGKERDAESYAFCGSRLNYR
jgi:hypothetical protein